MTNNYEIQKHQTTLQADELSRALYSCSMLARKIITYSVTKIQEKELGNKMYYQNNAFQISVPASEFKISELLKALNLTKNGKNYELIKEATRELRNCSLEIKDKEGNFKIWNWFQFIQYDKTRDKIELHFSSQIGWALLEFQNGYTALNLKTVGEFKSFYAFRFYEIALSWIGMKGKNGNPKGKWYFQMGIDEIRNTFKIDPNAYSGRMDNFKKYVIDNPIKELNEVCDDFKIEVLRVVRGREVLGFRFECSETKKESKKIAIKKTDSDELKKKKKELNAETELIEKLKKAHPERWEQILAEEKSQGVLFGGKELAELFAIKNAEKRLCDEFSRE